MIKEKIEVNNQLDLTNCQSHSYQSVFDKTKKQHTNCIFEETSTKIVHRCERPQTMPMLC